MKRFLVLTAVVLFAVLFVGMAQGRTWTDAKGKKVNADFVSLLQLDEPKVKLKTSSGKYILVPLRNLSKEDQDYILKMNDNKDRDINNSAIGGNDLDDNNSEQGNIIPKSGSNVVTESVVYPLVKNMDINSREAYEALIQLRDEDLTKIEPDYTIALLFIFTNKDYLHAQQHFNRCLKIKPDDAGTLLNLGTLSILQGKYPEAFSFYQKAYTLGGVDQTLNQNIHKLIDESSSRNIILPASARSKVSELAGKVSKRVKTQYTPKKGWMFEKCSEGVSEESNKCHWFQLDGYRPYEFPICMKCNGTGKAYCPNKNCSSGKVPYMENVTRRFPNGDTATMPTRKYKTCNVCDGSSRIKCPACNGSCFEISKSEVASQINKETREREAQAWKERQEREAQAWKERQEREAQARKEAQAKEAQAKEEAREKERKEIDYALKNRSIKIKDCMICITKMEIVHRVPLENAYSGRNGVSELDNYLVLEIVVFNKSETKKINFDSWAGDRLNMGSKAMLKDEHGNEYKRFVFGTGMLVVGNKDHDSIYPDNFIIDRVVFERPINKAKKLTLILPGKNIEQEDDIKIELNTSEIQYNPSI